MYVHRAKLPGVKGLNFTHQLRILDEGPLKGALNVALIHAEAAVRSATKKFGGGGSGGGGGGDAADAGPTDGAIWWMNRDLAEKKKRYGR